MRSRELKLGTEQTAAITAFVDIDAPPPASEPTAHVIFGTNQIQPVEIVADRHKRGLAPLIIATGGVNRHDGRHFFASLLIADGLSVKAVSQILGHEDEVETLRTYAHLWPTDDERSRAAVDSFFFGEDTTSSRPGLVIAQ